MTWPDGFTPSDWGDLPPASYRVGEGKLSGTVTVVFADEPNVAWSVQCSVFEGRPRVLRLTVSGVGREVFLDEYVTRPPFRRLAAFWSRVMGVGETTGPDLVALLSDSQPVTLPRKPDPRRYGGTGTEKYQEAVREWSRPIAEEVRHARAQARPVHAWIRERFGVGQTRAEDLVRDARKAHDLPYSRPPKPRE